MNAAGSSSYVTSAIWLVLSVYHCSQSRRKAARDGGASRVVLETTATWTGARRLYEHEGFVLDGVVHGPHGDDAHYHLDLATA